MPQFDTTFFVGQIFWMLLSFGFLYLMMATLICPMIEEVLAERQQKIDSYLDGADRLNHQAEQIHQRMQVYHLETEQLVAEQLQSASAKLQQESQKAEAKNEKSLRQKIHQVEKEISEANHTFIEETSPLIHKMAQALIHKLTGGES